MSYFVEINKSTHGWVNGNGNKFSRLLYFSIDNIFINIVYVYYVYVLYVYEYEWVLILHIKNINE